MPEHAGRIGWTVSGRPTIRKDAFAHCVDKGAHPSTVAASTPGTRSISSSMRSSSAGAAVVSYFTSDGRIMKVTNPCGSNPRDA